MTTAIQAALAQNDDGLWTVTPGSRPKTDLRLLEVSLCADFATVAGGDDEIAVYPDVGATAFDEAIEHVRAETGIELQVGIGSARTAHAAGAEARAALEQCRATGARIRDGDQRLADD